MITVETEPQLYTPVYNDMFFVVTSDNITELSFNYIFDVYYDGVFQTRHRIAPRPSDQKGVFNVKRVLESLVTNDSFSDLDTMITRNSNSFKTYNINYGEEYDVSGTLTLFPDLVAGTAKYVFNGSLQFEKFIDFSYPDYDLINTDGLFLTNNPVINVETDDRYYLYSICSTPSNLNKVVIKTYNAGGLVSTYSKSSTYTTTLDLNMFLRLAVGPKQVKSEFGSTVLDNITYYTVETQTSGSVRKSEIKTFNIVDNCTKYTPVRVHFLNELGGFDSFTFTKVSTNQVDAKRSEYTKNATEVVTTKDRYITQSNISTKYALTVNSDWITDDQSVWIHELLTSPVIFEERNNKFYALKCTEHSWQTSKKENEKVFNVTIKFEYGFTNERQRY